MQHIYPNPYRGYTQQCLVSMAGGPRKPGWARLLGSARPPELKKSQQNFHDCDVSNQCPVLIPMPSKDNENDTTTNNEKQWATRFGACRQYCSSFFIPT